MKNKLDSMEKKKRGTISVDFLITMILLILGFAILIIFLFNIGGTGSLDRTVCEQSVTMRATLPGIVKTVIPLKCQTNKICITSGKITDIFKKSECRDFAGETGINYVKVSGLTQIEQIYAREIYDCWNMMGQGKLSLFSQNAPSLTGLGSVYPTCVICTRIAYDAVALKSLGINAEDIDIQGYMMTHKVPEKNYTYFEFIAGNGGAYSVEEFKENNAGTSTVNVKDDAGNDLTSTSVEKQSITESLDLSKQGTAILFSQISSPKTEKVFRNQVIGTLAGLGVTGNFKLGSFFTLTKSPLKVNYGAPVSTAGAARTVSLGVTTFLKRFIWVQVAIGAITQAGVQWNRGITAGYCGDVSSTSEAREGCSVVRAIPYEPEMISSYCSDIESIP